jgi:integrase
MPHFPKPFYRSARKAWFVQLLDGRQVNLGPDREEAFRQYHELMGQKKAEPVKPVGHRVVDLMDLFLDWCKAHRAGLTYTWYKERITAFCNFTVTHPKQDGTRVKVGLLPVELLKPFHVQQWVDSHADWSGSHKRGCTIAVQRPLRWAEKIGHIDKSPIRHVDKPEAGKRQQVISQDEYEKTLGLMNDEQFKDLLVVSWETGCRPQEITIVEARHVDLEHHRWIFPPEEAKGRKRFRVVYLTDKAFEITTRLMALHPEGVLFRNTDGEAWRADAINCRFCRLQARVGRALLNGHVLDPKEVQKFASTLPKEVRVKGVTRLKTEKELLREARKKLTTRAARKLGGKICLYNFRHSWCQAALKRGVDPVTVSVLMGHVDQSMIGKIYNHLAQDSQHMRDAAKKAREEKPKS